MANIAVADATMSLVAGIICGVMILHGVPPGFNSISNFNMTEKLMILGKNTQSIITNLNLTDIEGENQTTTR
jgi:hypothetical protein